jgi:predicted dehydrogenase
MTLERSKLKGDVEVVALCDVYERRLRKAGAKVPNAKRYTIHQELLARTDLDAVVIATPDHWHAPITIAALKGKRDVYCEKPMTHTIEEAFAVEKAAKESGKLVQIGVQSLSWTKWEKAREVIQKGMLGKVVSCHGSYSRNDPAGDWNWPIDSDAGPEATGEARIDWKQWLGSAPARKFDADRFFRFRKYWDYSGGIATDLHYHTLASFHMAVKNEFPARVTGMGGMWVYRDGRETPDTFLNSGDYPSEWSALIQSSQVNSTGPEGMIRGTKATMFFGADWEGKETNELRIVAEKPYVEEFTKQWGQAEVVIPGCGNEGDQKHVDNFFDCVKSRKEPVCNLDLSLKVMVHIGLAVKSHRENRMYRFDPVLKKGV